MAEPETPQNPISAAYRRARQLVARLASKPDPALSREGREVAEQLLAHVRSQVEDYAAFEERVRRSEEFSLHESAQVAKTEKELKVLYLGAIDLIDTIRESEDRTRPRP